EELLLTRHPSGTQHIRHDIFMFHVLRGCQGVSRRRVIVACLGSFGDHFLPLITPEANVRGVQITEAPIAGAESIVLTAPHDSDALRAAVTDEVRWIHSLSTGIDGFPLELGRGRTLTCSRGSAAVPIAEYV